ncbi:hypothetical protein IEQ34_000520 [Dendrobium chrysotoxum]|uniref:Uncharacterized protein n=1 Tax=Dendrobium chrysotoxum TaxID=161865 RepID=A0AAV7HQN7_DENCH|nr:hypothetical protein IEQ34_000520 [Dendrobium chrysotoxum]
MTAIVEEGITAFANGTVIAAFANGTVIGSPVKGTSDSVGPASGTRRSTRQLGRERPYYGKRREPEIEELPRKRRICQRKRVSKTSLIHLKSNVALDTLDSDGWREPAEEKDEAPKQRLICRGKVVSQTTHDSFESNVASVVNGVGRNAKVCLLSDQWKDNNGISVEPELNINDECGDSGQASNGTNKSAHIRVKETLRAFNTNYLQFVQEEELRVKSVEAQKLKISKEPKSKVSNGDVDLKRASKRPDLKAISKASA